ncbi:MAG: hypothetical protein GEU99_03105 [Luteitalea sp.]|nr:hypothetical protein [Luteitalea sp.]
MTAPNPVFSDHCPVSSVSTCVHVWITTLAVYLWIFATPVVAQTYQASVRGIVRDASRQPVAGLTLTLTREETGEVRTTTSGELGEFALAQLPPGRHRLELDAPGHAHYVHVLTLEVAQAAWIDARLQIAARGEDVTVTAPRVPLELDSAARGTLIDEQWVARLPLDGRNFLELALLAPGAAPAAPGSATSIRGDFAFNANGAREDANSYVLDGAYNVDPELNGVGVRPPVDAIRAFEVTTSTYDASFGRNAGAQVNVVTKSGSNRFDGTLYGFLRNGALDARNVFAPQGEQAPEYERSQLGGSAGGPLVRDRLFFFADYEGTRLTEGTTRLANVPTLAERQGDFTQSLSEPPIDPFTGQPFAGGIIPPERLDPVGVAVAALYPAPNRDAPSANFVSSPSLRDRNDQFDGRVDRLLGSASTLTARYSFADRRLYEPFSGAGFATVPGFGTNVPRRAQHLGVSLGQVLSSRLVNEARVAWSRVSSGTFHENMGHSLNRDLGLPELSPNDRDWGLSFITVTGHSPLGDGFNEPQHSSTNMVQVGDTLTWTRGDHLVKTGIDVRALGQDAYRDVQSRGFLTFSNQAFSGHALADLLLGLPTLTGGAQIDNPQRLRAHSLNVFINDSVRVTPALTLSAGLRYEYNAPAVDADDRATLYDPATGSLVRVGADGMPRGGYVSDRNNVAPRVGAAWALGSNARTVIRGGYGLHYDQSALAPSEGLYFNEPYYDVNTYFPLPERPLTLDDPFPDDFPVPQPNAALAIQRDLQTAALHHFSAGVQRQLGGSASVDVAYVGSRGRHLTAARDLNQPSPSPQPLNPRPNPGFADITFIESRATSQYDSLQLAYSQRLDRGLSVLAAFTLGKSTDDRSSFFASAGDANFPQDSNNVAAENGRSNFDVRQRFSLAFAYALPFGRGRTWLQDRAWVSALLGEWDVEGVVILQSGRPFTVALLPEVDNSNTGRASLGFGANDRPNQVRDPSVSDPSPDRWFDTTAFALPPFGTFGNVGRNTLEGPGYQNLNLGLLKHLPLGTSARAQIRVEVFNLLNRTNFDLPDNFFGSPTFGQILSAGAPRRVQIGVKILW